MAGKDPAEVSSEIELYDRAVWQYLATTSDKIVYETTQNAFRTITKREKFSDNKPWSFISYHRSPNIEIDWERMNNPMTVSGDFTRLTGHPDATREARYVHSIPVDLTYVIDVWAPKASIVQALAVKLVSQIFIQDQVLYVPINPDGEMGRFHILDIQWTDNSDLERETEIGKIYRHTISFTVDARLTLVRDVATDKFEANVPEDIYNDNEGD